MSKYSTAINRKPSPELLSAVRVYFEAHAAVKTLKPIVTKIQIDLLDKLEINYDPKYEKRGRKNTSERITNPNHMHLMSEADIARYCSALDTAYRSAGFTVPEGYCPLLMAESAQMRAENALLDAAINLHGRSELSSQNLYGELRTRAIEANLGYLAQFLK